MANPTPRKLSKTRLLSLSSLTWWPEVVFEGIAFPLEVCVAHEDLNQVLRRDMYTRMVRITTPEVVIRQMTRMGVVWSWLHIGWKAARVSYGFSSSAENEVDSGQHDSPREMNKGSIGHFQSTLLCSILYELDFQNQRTVTHTIIRGRRRWPGEPVAHPVTAYPVRLLYASR